jgi:hypothetical protein
LVCVRRTVEQAACRDRAFASDVPQASFVLTQVVTCDGRRADAWPPRIILNVN